MENNIHEYEEISLQEIIGMLWKNRYFIATFLAAGLLLGLIFSGIKVIQNPVEYRYQAKATVELINGAEMQNQPQTMLHVMKSRSILEDAMGKLKISNGDYEVTTDASSKPNQFDIMVEGPDREHVVSLVNEIVAQGRAIAAPAMTLSSNAIIENGHISGSPVEISKGVNIVLNVMISLVLAGMLSVFLIFAIRYMSGKIYSKDEVEQILGTKVMTSIPFEGTNKRYEKFLKVR